MIRFVVPTALLALLTAGIAAAQSRPAQEAAALVLARQEAAEAARRSAALERDAARATDEAKRARAQADAVAARIEAAEAEITVAETRLRIVEARRAEQRARLAERQAPVVRLTAALQTMARRPSALALIQPGSLDDVVHVRSLLATTLPAVRARTASIRQEIARSEALRVQAVAAAASLTRGREELRRRRAELAGIEARQRRRSETLIETALTESDRALAFGEEAREISTRMSSRQSQTRLQRFLQSFPGPVLRPLPVDPAQPDAGQRLADYRLPVQGRLITGTGEISDAGVHARGLVFEVDSATPVHAPAPGRVAYAGRFRGYGEIVIVDHGGGWTSVVTNLTRREVEAGAQVGAGALLGRTGSGASRVAVELRHGGKPVAITEQLHGS